MRKVKLLVGGRTVLLLVGLCCSLLSWNSQAEEFFFDIQVEAPYGQTTLLTIVQSTLNLPNTQSINPCIDDTCVAPFVVSNEIYTASGATIQFTPPDYLLTGETYRVPYSACLDQCQFDSYSGDIVFTVVRAPELEYVSEDGADSVFANDVCRVEDPPSYCVDFANLSFADKQKALASINPEEVSAGSTETQQMARSQMGNMSQRFGELQAGVRGISVAGLTYTLDGHSLSGQWLEAMADSIGGSAGADEPSLMGRWGFFINGSITQGEYDGSEKERRYENKANTVTMGVDYRFAKGLVGGIAYGVSRSALAFSGNGDEMDSKMSNLLFYGTKYTEQFTLDVLIGVTQGEMETSRTITFLNTVAQAKADTEQFLLSIGGSYDFSHNALSFGPYLRIDVIDGHIDAYEESNGGGLEVGFDQQKMRSRILTAGGQLSYVFSISQGVVMPHLRLEWKKEYDNGRNVVAGHFASTLNKDNFSVSVERADTRWLQFAVGVSTTFKYGLSAYVDFERLLDVERTEQHTFSYGGRWQSTF